MKMLMHNVNARVTVAASYNEDDHSISYALAFCKRNADTFSRKRGNQIASVRLGRNPRRHTLPFSLSREQIHPVAFGAIRDAIRSADKRRTEESLVAELDGVISNLHFIVDNSGFDLETGISWDTIRSEANKVYPKVASEG